MFDKLLETEMFLTKTTYLAPSVDEVSYVTTLPPKINKAK